MFGKSEWRWSRRCQLVSRSNTSEIPADRRFHRAGIIPYCQHDEVNYFFMSVDARYRQLTDPGGTIFRGEDFISGACRELEEESLGIFDLRSEENRDKIRNNSIAYYSDDMIIIFQRVEVKSMLEICTRYKEKYHKMKKDGFRPENSHLIWVTENHLLYLLLGKEVSIPTELAYVSGIGRSYPRLYHKVKSFLLTALDRYPTIL